MLAAKYGWSPHYEPVSYNPYLPDYYEDMGRWAFNLEIYFLKQRFKDLMEIARSEGPVIQDRTIFEGVYVFAQTNREMGNMDDRDYETYMELFEDMMLVVKYPDLMVYLRSSVPHLVANIQKRGRDYERAIQIDYLKNLNARYEDFIFNKYKGKLLVVDVDNIDFQHNHKDFEQIADRIDARLFGFFSDKAQP